VVKKFHIHCAIDGIFNSDFSYLSQKLTELYFSHSQEIPAQTLINISYVSQLTTKEDYLYEL
jgi:hypothetical protein